MRAAVVFSASISTTWCGRSRVGLCSSSPTLLHSSRHLTSGGLSVFVERGGRCGYAHLGRSQSARLSSVVRASTSSVSEAPVRTAVESMEVLVKAAVGEPDKLGDCPFSQRVLLTLEEKNIEYSAKYIDTSNKPQWFLEANPEGKVPVIKHEGKWVADSDVITALLEELHPEPSLVSPDETKAVGSKIFGAFIKFLTSKDSTDDTEQALLDELSALDVHLKKSGKYINGEKVTSVDLALAPKLYHLKVALGHYKKWTVPNDLQHVQQYMEDIFSRESFQKTRAEEKFVVKGWEAKVKAP